MSDNTRSELIDLYRRGPDLLAAALAPIPQEARGFEPGGSRWSIHRIVIHIVDADLAGFMRLRKPVAEPGATVSGYSQEAWAAKLHPESIATEAALELLRAYRSYNLAYLAALSEAEWSGTVLHPERGEITLEAVLAMYARHPGLHIDHIERTYAAWQRVQAGEQLDPNESFWVPPGR